MGVYFKSNQIKSNLFAEKKQQDTKAGKPALTWAQQKGTIKQKGSFAVITQECNKTANINVKKLQFIHKLTASDTSKTAKITKGDITQQHIDI